MRPTKCNLISANTFYITLYSSINSLGAFQATATIIVLHHFYSKTIVSLLLNIISKEGSKANTEIVP